MYAVHSVLMLLENLLLPRRKKMWFLKVVACLKTDKQTFLKAVHTNKEVVKQFMNENRC